MVALNNDHRFAVYPYWIRRSFFSERTRLHRVPPQLRWWQDRKGRPTDGKVIMPAANVAPLGLAEEAALLDESHVLPKVACGSGQISEETLRFNGLSSRIGIKEALRAEGFSRIRHSTRRTRNPTYPNRANKGELPRIPVLRRT